MAEEKSQKTDSGSEPKKRRRPMWKVLLISFGVFVLVLFAIWLILNILMDHRLKTKFAEYRAAGQPTKIEEFWSPEIPDEENAAIPIRLAAKSLALSTDDTKNLDQMVSVNFVRDNPDRIEKLLAANAASEKYLVESRDKNKFSLNFKPTNAYQNLLPSLGEYRMLTRLHAVRAIDFAVKGDSDAAIKCVEDMERIAACMSDSNCLIGMFVQINIEVVSAQTLEEILPHIARPASQAAPDRLKVGFLDESLLHRSARMASCSERLWMMDVIKIIFERGGDVFSGGSAMAVFIQKYGKWPCAPITKKQMLDNIRIIDSCAAAIMETNYPAARKKMMPLPDDFLSQKIDYVASFWAGSFLLPSLDRGCDLFFHAIASRRMAAVAIAMKQYEWDNGKRPAKLSDLVPKYLAAVPVDPFSAAGEAIKLGAWGGRRLLYSVGVNGADEGGQYAALPNDKVDQEKYDIPFFLDGNRPNPSATSSAAPTTSAPASQGTPNVATTTAATPTSLADDSSYLEYKIPDDAVKQEYSTKDPSVRKREYKDNVTGDLIAVETLDDGKVVRLEMFKNKLLHGIQKEWYPNGQLKSAEPYKDGNMHGVFRYWSENGKLVGRCTFKDGTGAIVKYYENGRLREETEYKNNMEDGKIFAFKPNGQLCSLSYKTSNNFRCGLGSFVFSEKGILLGIGICDGKAFSESSMILLEFRSSGQQKALTYYLNGHKVSADEYAKASAADPNVPKYESDPKKYVQAYYTDAVKKIVKEYKDRPPVKIPLVDADVPPTTSAPASQGTPNVATTTAATPTSLADDNSYLEYKIPDDAVMQETRGFCGKPIRKYTDKATGELIAIETLDEGKVVRLELFKNKLRHGVQKWWYYNGQLKSAEPYKDGNMHGVFRYWSKNGKLVGRCVFKEGNGAIIKYHENGRLEEIVEYNNNKKNGKVVGFAYDNGQVTGLTYRSDGKSILGVGGFSFMKDGTLRLVIVGSGRSGCTGPTWELNESKKMSLEYMINGRPVSAEVYAKAASTDPTLPKYESDPQKFINTYYTDAVKKIIKEYKDRPPVKIPLVDADVPPTTSAPTSGPASAPAMQPEDNSYLDYTIPDDAVMVEVAGRHPMSRIRYYRAKDDDTKIIAQEIFERGMLVKLELFKNKLLHGVQKEWYSNGQLKSAEPYKDGVRHGVFRYWSKNGKLVGRCVFKEGNGAIVKYYENGRLEEESEYKNNLEDGKLFGFSSDNGQIAGMAYKKEGSFVCGASFCFYEDGAMRGMAVVDGKAEGRASLIIIEFDRAGKPGAFIYMINGRRVSAEEYAKASAADPKLPKYESDPQRFINTYYTDAVKKIVKEYKERPPVKIPLVDADVPPTTSAPTSRP